MPLNSVERPKVCACSDFFLRVCFNAVNYLFIDLSFFGDKIVGESLQAPWMASSRYTILQSVGLVVIKFLQRTRCTWLKP